MLLCLDILIFCIFQSLIIWKESSLSALIDILMLRYLLSILAINQPSTFLSRTFWGQTQTYFNSLQLSCPSLTQHEELQRFAQTFRYVFTQADVAIVQLKVTVSVRRLLTNTNKQTNLCHPEVGARRESARVSVSTLRPQVSGISQPQKWRTKSLYDLRTLVRTAFSSTRFWK